MRKFLISAAFLAVSMAPTVAGAQAIPAAVVAVVDLDKVTTDCTACSRAYVAEDKLVPVAVFALVWIDPPRNCFAYRIFEAILPPCSPDFSSDSFR